MRRLFAILLLCVLGIFTMPVVASAAGVSPIVNVKYVHDAIRTKWNLDIPYNPNLSSPSAAANMRYVLGMVDRANARFGVETNYGTGEYATSAAANQNTTTRAIETLIQKPIEFPFSMTTTPDTKTFSFRISASGTFYVDWGDGSDVDEYVKNDTNDQEISHTYATAGAYTVRLGGRATGYASSGSTAAISFYTNMQLAGIDGSLGAIFPTLADGTQPRFVNTFSSCSGLTGSIPENLFAGISGAPASNMFSRTFYMCRGLTGEIPEKLFAGISGAPAEYMFDETFYGCNRLTGSIPEKLFAGISGAPAESMFSGTFQYCGLTGSIPENLFAGISGAPAKSMFSGTFYGCRGLTGSIPEKLFAGISGAPAIDMFGDTFLNCTNLTGSIPEKLFAGISGAPASDMFGATFGGCSGLTGSIPENLFAGISGAPETRMFNGTFSGCSGLTGSIPENLFAGISGAPAYAMFTATFSGCSGLTGSIPENLFAGISGAPAESMFDATFYNCSGLTGISGSLFAGISGAPASGMFSATFHSCSGLTGEIPVGLFGNLSDWWPWRGMFRETFYNCSGLTGKSARNPDGTPLYDVLLTAGTSEVGGMYTGTCLDDNAFIPEAWGKNPDCVSAEPEYSFFMTTTPDTKTFSFNIGASGTFYVDWGDGSDFDEYVKNDTGEQEISHTYTTAGAYTVRLGGHTTRYGTGAAISFASTRYQSLSNDKLAGISGSLGEIFRTLADGTQPSFYQTFYNCTNLTGSIPENLFAGISGAPAEEMFRDTFWNCSGLTGSIPEKLFAGISGAPAKSMFDETFYGCNGLTGEIPVGLFGNLSGRPVKDMFFYTFYNCSGLTGKSARNPDGTPLYDVFPTATTDEVAGMYRGTCLADNASIPDDWGGRNASCVYSGPTE